MFNSFIKQQEVSGQFSLFCQEECLEVLKECFRKQKNSYHSKNKYLKSGCVKSRLPVFNSLFQDLPHVEKIPNISLKSVYDCIFQLDENNYKTKFGVDSIKLVGAYTIQMKFPLYCCFDTKKKIFFFYMT